MIPGELLIIGRPGYCCRPPRGPAQCPPVELPWSAPAGNGSRLPSTDIRTNPARRQHRFRSCRIQGPDLLGGIPNESIAARCLGQLRAVILYVVGCCMLLPLLLKLIVILYIALLFCFQVQKRQVSDIPGLTTFPDHAKNH